MKTAIVFMCFLALNAAAPKSLSLQQDILDFIQLLPVEDIRKTLDKHLRNDPEFQAAAQYFQSAAFEKLSLNVLWAEPVKEMEKYIMDAGLNSEFIFAFLEEFISQDVIKTHHKHPSVKKFVDDLNAIIPHQKLADLLQEKMEDSPYFQDFYRKLSSERFHKIVERVMDLPEVQAWLGKLKELDVPVHRIIRSLYIFLGWPSPFIGE